MLWRRSSHKFHVGKAGCGEMSMPIKPFTLVSLLQNDLLIFYSFYCQFHLFLLNRWPPRSTMYDSCVQHTVVIDSAESIYSFEFPKYNLGISTRNVCIGFLALSWFAELSVIIVPLAGFHQIGPWYFTLKPAAVETIALATNIVAQFSMKVWATSTPLRCDGLCNEKES
jgi:hypothetical protein